MLALVHRASEVVPEPVALLRGCLEEIVRGDVTLAFFERARGRTLTYGWQINFGQHELWFDLPDHDLNGELFGRFRSWDCHEPSQTARACDALRRLLLPA